MATHCDQHKVFNRICDACRDAVLDDQVENLLLDREADQDQDQDQDQDRKDRFAYRYGDQEDQQDQDNGIQTSKGFIESNLLDTVIVVDFGLDN